MAQVTVSPLPVVTQTIETCDKPSTPPTQTTATTSATVTAQTPLPEVPLTSVAEVVESLTNFEIFGNCSAVMDDQGPGSHVSSTDTVFEEVKMLTPSTSSKQEQDSFIQQSPIMDMERDASPVIPSLEGTTGEAEQENVRPSTTSTASATPNQLHSSHAQEKQLVIVERSSEQPGPFSSFDENPISNERLYSQLEDIQKLNNSTDNRTFANSVALPDFRNMVVRDFTKLRDNMSTRVSKFSAVKMHITTTVSELSHQLTRTGQRLEARITILETNLGTYLHEIIQNL